MLYKVIQAGIVKSLTWNKGQLQLWIIIIMSLYRPTGSDRHRRFWSTVIAGIHAAVTGHFTAE